MSKEEFKTNNGITESPPLSSKEKSDSDSNSIHPDNSDSSLKLNSDRSYTQRKSSPINPLASREQYANDLRKEQSEAKKSANRNRLVYSSVNATSILDKDQVVTLEPGKYLRFEERPQELLKWLHIHRISHEGFQTEASSTFPSTYIIQGIESEHIGLVMKTINANFIKN